METHGQYLKEFRTAFGDLGYEEGRNHALNICWGERALDGLRNNAAQLVGAGPDVILATGTAVLSTIKRETQTLPVVLEPYVMGSICLCLTIETKVDPNQRA